MTAGPRIINVGYRSTNYWVLVGESSHLLVDLGWPGQVRELLHNLKRAGLDMRDIRHGFATHYHPDHAGAAQDLKLLGMRLLVTPEQVAAIPQLARWCKPRDRYTPITEHDNVVVPLHESRTVLAQIGISGSLVHTPGHSADSVSLLLDSGEAFTGDLTHEALVGTEDPEVVAASWERLRALGGHTVYPGHGAIRPLA